MAAGITEAASNGRTRTTSPGIFGSAGLRSLLIAAAGYLVFYGLLHPGYAILDDVKIISIAVGYPGVQPAPFLVFSNVLLGLILEPLYAIGSQLNWEILLFSLVNFLSLWILLFILLSGMAPRAYKIFGTILILACDSYFALNITFSSTAALGCFAGLSAMVTAAIQWTEKRRAFALGGMALVLVGSLVRIQMLYLMLPLVAAAVPFLYQQLRLRKLGMLIAVAAILVFGGYAFDRLYVRAHPDWNMYYFYNQIAQMVQDSHRLENMHLEIRRIGWSGNDQELFARSFFPDPGIYSVDRLRYLVEHVSGIGQDPLFSAQSLAGRLGSLAAVPFLLVCLAAWLWVMASGASAAARLAIPALTLLSVCEAIGLTWVYKDPEYVLLASLANTAMLATLIPGWKGKDGQSPRTHTGQGTAARVLMGVSLIAGISAVVLSTSVAITTSNANLDRQAAYARILGDLQDLQTNGRLPENAVIISPAYGIPVDWSNPFLLDFPKIPYLDTGWITFSPPYEQALRNFGIAALPEALYEKSNVYLMSETIFKDFLARYYEEHGGTTVRFETVYTLGYPDRYAGYHEVELYKVLKVP